MRVSSEPSASQITIGHEQPENVECCNCLCSFVTNDARCTCIIKCLGKSIIPKEDYFYHQIGLKLKEKPGEMSHLEPDFLWSWNLDSSESRLGITEKCLTWCWRRLGQISWTDRLRNEEVLHSVKEKGNILYIINRRKARLECIYCLTQLSGGYIYVCV